MQVFLVAVVLVHLLLGSLVMVSCSVGVQLTCGIVEVVQQAERLCNTCQDADLYGLEFIPENDDMLLIYQNKGCLQNSTVIFLNRIAHYNWCPQLQHRSTRLRSFKLLCSDDNNITSS